jgi:hypothetical protein
VGGGGGGCGLWWPHYSYFGMESNILESRMN